MLTMEWKDAHLLGSAPACGGIESSLAAFVMIARRRCAIVDDPLLVDLAGLLAGSEKLGPILGETPMMLLLVLPLKGPCCQLLFRRP